MSEPLRVVFDCNIFLQALARPQGASGRCVSLALERRVILVVSPFVLDEVLNVTSRPELIRKFKLRSERVEALLATLPSVALVLDAVPNSWSYDRDPDDAHYVNLALAAHAKLIVSRDADLLDLMDMTRAEAMAFHDQFPSLRILDPGQFLREFELQAG